MIKHFERYLVIGFISLLVILFIVLITTFLSDKGVDFHDKIGNTEYYQVNKSVIRELAKGKVPQVKLRESHIARVIKVKDEEKKEEIEIIQTKRGGFFVKGEEKKIEVYEIKPPPLEFNSSIHFGGGFKLSERGSFAFLISYSPFKYKTTLYFPTFLISFPELGGYLGIEKKIAEIHYSLDTKFCDILLGAYFPIMHKKARFILGITIHMGNDKIK